MFKVPSFSTFSYDEFINLLFKAANQVIPPIKHTYINYIKTPIWWNSDCTEAAKNRISVFRLFRRSPFLSDFIEYRKICSVMKRIFKKVKREAWRKYCSGLNLSVHISNLWKTAKIYNNCLHLPPSNKYWFPFFVI